MGEPSQAPQAENHGDVEVEPQSEDVLRGVDAQKLLPDPGERVPGDVEGKQAGRSDPAVMAKPDQRPRKPEIPDQLIEEGRMEGGELLVARRTVGRVYLKAPRQACRAAEELLVEVVPDPTDRLGDQQPRRRGVHELGDVRTAAA
ncbi:MAG TPA: hypothetical protein VHU24_10750 [Solirubrobacterales bacterium]|nr:hypothetical protein [Solirubrobacterales bacterium]